MHTHAHIAIFNSHRHIPVKPSPPCRTRGPRRIGHHHQHNGGGGGGGRGGAWGGVEWCQLEEAAADDFADMARWLASTPGLKVYCVPKMPAGCGAAVRKAWRVAAEQMYDGRLAEHSHAARDKEDGADAQQVQTQLDELD